MLSSLHFRFSQNLSSLLMSEQSHDGGIEREPCKALVIEKDGARIRLTLDAECHLIFTILQNSERFPGHDMVRQVRYLIDAHSEDSGFCLYFHNPATGKSEKTAIIKWAIAPLHKLLEAIQSILELSDYVVSPAPF